ncbi:29779_t:CDS:2 [Racocetra persica]|uniref:29779_t:CDS:1 n=1 Tax=Racocetra persica TaxID=160502 RepID=A0ACA9N3B8_9GLOM|nr:29779_t:CDS:2 [Racocetra persica]
MSSSTAPIVQPKNPEVPRYKGDYGTTKAALSAAGIANVVVFSFIITAFMEDSGDKHQKRDKED